MAGRCGSRLRMRIYMLKNKVIYFIYPFYLIENTEHTGEIFPVTNNDFMFMNMFM